MAPEQQPLGQVVLLQPLQRPPSVQVSPPGHISHALPPLPHDAGDSPGRHTPAAQQPVGQDVPSQTQVLPMQRWPRAHVAPVPHRQAPAAEQLSARLSQLTQVDPASPHVCTVRGLHFPSWQHPLGHDVVSQMHWAPRQRCPPAHASAVPQRQTPFGPQRSARSVSQSLQVPPRGPQVASD